MIENTGATLSGRAIRTSAVAPYRFAVRLRRCYYPLRKLALEVFYENFTNHFFYIDVFLAWMHGFHCHKIQH